MSSKNVIPFEVLINNPLDVKYYHERVFGCQSNRLNSYISEWRCLLNTLKKNLFLHCIDPLLEYPYRVLKREEPDFEIVLSSGEVMLIEITRATTMKNEALKHQLSVADDDIDIAEVTNDMFTLDKPQKDEMSKNLVRRGGSLQGDPMYGNYAEKQWSIIVASSINGKMDKPYAGKVNILLIGDLDLPYNDKAAVKKRYKYLKTAVDEIPYLSDSTVFPTIIADSPGALGVIRMSYEWLCTPLFLSDHK